MVMKRLALAVAVGLASSIAMAGTAAASTSPNLCIAVMGSNDWCGDGLAATHAKLAVPRGLAPLAGGGFLVADSVNHVIRRVDSRGTITTIAGTGAGGFPRFGKPAADNVLGTPMGVAALPCAGYLIADSTLKQVLRVTADGRLVVAAGRGAAADPPTTSGDGGRAVAARLRSPRDVDVLPGGGYLIVDSDDNRVRRVAADGKIETLAGTGVAGFSGDGGPAARARLSQPTAASVAPDGSVLVADRGNARIRRIARDGRISTVAGGGVGATAALATVLEFPTAVAATADGGFLVAEAATIRRVAPDGSTAIVAGTGRAGFNRRSRPATAAAIAYPTALAVLPDGRALVADTLNDRVRLLDLARSRLKTVAGSGVPGPPGTPEPAPGVTLDPPKAPNPDAPIVTEQQLPAASTNGGAAAFVEARRRHCPLPTDLDPRAFSTPLITPLNPAVLRTGRKVTPLHAQPGGNAGGRGPARVMR